jgi:hypothetical protein
MHKRAGHIHHGCTTCTHRHRLLLLLLLLLLWLMLLSLLRLMLPPQLLLAYIQALLLQRLCLWKALHACTTSIMLHQRMFPAWTTTVTHSGTASIAAATTATAATTTITAAFDFVWLRCGCSPSCQRTTMLLVAAGAAIPTAMHTGACY